MTVKLYGSVNGKSQEITKLYGSVNGVSKEIKKLYGSVNGVSKLIYTAETIPYAELYGTVYYKASPSDTTVLSVDLRSVEEFDSLCDPNWNMSIVATVGGGTVTVRNSGSNVIVGVDIGSEITSIKAGFLRCCSYFNSPLVIPSNVTSIGNQFVCYCTSFNQPITIPSRVTSIGNNFLSDCTSFNQSLTLPSSLTSIGNNFLSGCTSFNQSLTLPSSLTSIDMNFLFNCSAFNKPITIPSRVTSLKSYFLNECKAMVDTVNIGSLAATVATASNYSFTTTSSSAACYTTGIKIAGANRAAWLSRFPNKTSSPYRKLVDAGY